MLWKYLSDPNNLCKFRALSIGPQSQWVILRAELEPGHPTTNHINISAMFLNNLKVVGGNKVMLRYY